MPKIVGLDLGTSNSCMAIMRTGGAVIIPPANDMQRRVTPTVVGYPDGGPPIVGQVARMQSMSNPQFTFSGVKRLLGRQYEDTLVQEMMELAPFDIAAGPNGEAMLIGRENQMIAPEDILAEVVAKMKADAEPFLGEVVTHCILTIPAYFDPMQEQKAVAAVKRGGLTVVKTIMEPSAAALAYGYTREVGRTIAVYDFGGGTFDVSILRVRKRGFDLLAFDGDQFLGGQDFDRRIVDMFVTRLHEKTGLDVRGNRLSLQRLYERAEQAKETLSSTEVDNIVLQNLSDENQLNAANLSETLTREELEDMVRDLVARTIEPCENAMRKAKVSIEDIDDIVLVGGMTSMPLVRRTVEEIFGKEGRSDIPFDTAVAMGAALVGAAEQGTIKGVATNERLSHSIGFGDADGAMVKLHKVNDKLEKDAAKMVTTAVDDQRTALIDFYEGERDDVTACRHVLRIILKGIEPQPAGIAQIRVSASVGRDGMLTASVADSENLSNEVTRQVHLGSGMTRAEIDELLALGA
jgi:molecular chaperone DnaK